MRVTQNMLSNTMLLNLNNSLTRMDRLQEMLSTGKKISKPSHDPIVAVRGMLYRTNLVENKQFRENTDAAISWLEQSETAISEGVQILMRMKELLTQAANDTNSQGEREKIMQEMVQLRDQLGAVANTSFSGKNIFSGTQITNSAYDQSAQDMRSSPDINNDEINIEVSQQIYVPVNVTPDELFGAQGNSIFTDLGKIDSAGNATSGIFQHLQQSDGTAIKNDLAVIQKHMDNFLKVQASVGSRMNRIELIQNRLDTQSYGTEKMLSDEEDADLARVIIDLQNNENVHRAALASGSKIIQPTLLDFLR